MTLDGKHRKDISHKRFLSRKKELAFTEAAFEFCNCLRNKHKNYQKGMNEWSNFWINLCSIIGILGNIWVLSRQVKIVNIEKKSDTT